MSIDSIVGSAREFTSSGNTTRIILPVARNRSSFAREQHICSHGRRLHDCKLCGGRGICTHKRRRRQCALCGNPRVRRCPHGKVKYDCVDCKGGGICIHQRRRRSCKECGFAGKSNRKRKRREADANIRTRPLQGIKRLEQVQGEKGDSAPGWPVATHTKQGKKKDADKLNETNRLGVGRTES
jgi:hypothetical protein